MTIDELVKQGFHYARTNKSLWLFGFFVGMASGGSPVRYNQGGGDGGLSFAQFMPLLLTGVLGVVGLLVLRFVSEGALIEGIARIRKGGTMTTREGFRAGWAHWGVLVRIGLLYVASVVVSLALLVAPVVLALRAYGPLGALAVGIPALVIAVPWLVTLYLVQAFASRIAVLENRHALDAVGKARLFLHGRLRHGLSLIVATFVGTFLITLAGVIVLVPVVFLAVAMIPALGFVPVVLGCLAVLPLVYVLTAMLGTMRSSIWTIGYLTQVEA